MFRKNPSYAIVVAGLLAFGCSPPAKETAPTPSAPTAERPAGSPAIPPKGNAAPAAAHAALPESLKNDAYHYYGLSATKPIKMQIVSPNAGAPVTGRQSVKFVGMEGDRARFTISRSEGLAILGTEDVMLDQRGVSAVSSSLGELKGTTLEMPASLKPGVTWKSDVSLDMGDRGVAEDHSTFRVIGTEKVTTKVGTYEALLIESHGNQAAAGQKSVADIKFWFVKDRGAVKMEIKNTPQGGGPSTVTTIEEVP